MGNKYFKYWQYGAVLIACLFSWPAFSSNYTALVVYPDVGKPFNQVYENIISGIVTTDNLEVTKYKYDDSSSSDAFLKQLHNIKPKIIIVLGNKSYHFVKSLKLNIPTIISAVFEVLPKDNCICMNIEPSLVFKRLKKMHGDIKRVFVVFNPSTNQWMIKKAYDIADKLNIKLVAKQAKSSFDAAKIYKDILSVIKQTDAIWLPVDSVFPSDVILPEILQSAWDNKFIVFSTSPAYVKQGGLFAMYPDNKGMGHQIGKVSLDVIKQKHRTIRENTIYSKSAINIRTGHHLGMRFNDNQLSGFDVVFPNR
ncbi:MAG: hypothetical protein OEY52_11110 [Gammaproteobacteria bacterium]|nr:hypothetical protein [Gammaproteobacteria bacterium]